MTGYCPGCGNQQCICEIGIPDVVRAYRHDGSAITTDSAAAVMMRAMARNHRRDLVLARWASSLTTAVLLGVVHAFIGTDMGSFIGCAVATSGFAVIDLWRADRD